MLLRTNDIAYVSIMTAMSVLLLIISGYIETSTLFFLAAASFLTGVVEHYYGIVPAVLHLLCTVVLGVFIAPQKLYCMTFLCFGIYVIIVEYIEQYRKKHVYGWIIRLTWVIKGCVFETMLALILILYEYFIGISTMISDDVLEYTGSGVILWVIIIACSQILWIVFDRAYIYFMRKYGKLLRTKES